MSNNIIYEKEQYEVVGLRGFYCIFFMITREGRTKGMSKEVVVCVHDLGWKKNFLVQFEDGQKKEISDSLLVFLSSKEEVEMDEPLSHYPGK